MSNTSRPFQSSDWGIPQCCEGSQPWFSQMAWLTRKIFSWVSNVFRHGNRWKMMEIAETQNRGSVFWYQDLPKIWSGCSSVTVEVSMLLLDKSPLWLLHQGPNSARKWVAMHAHVFFAFSLLDYPLLGGITKCWPMFTPPNRQYRQYPLVI